MEITSSGLSALIIPLIMLSSGCKPEDPADLIILNAKVVTVDQDFSIKQAVAVMNGRIIATGTNKEIKKLSDKNTRIIDAKGKTVVPGLIDTHLHPESASVSELAEPLPDLHTIADLLSWIKEQTAGKPEGEWIIYPKLFPTRLRDMRQPVLSELDQAAPGHPVFLNGSFGGWINSAAMRISGISEKTRHPGILRDERTGRMTGFIRGSAFRLLKIPAQKQLNMEERADALEAMLKRYNSYGLTSLFSGSGNEDNIRLYRKLQEENRLSARIYLNMLFQFSENVTPEEVKDKIRKQNFRTGNGDEWIRTGPLKIYLDGGILTGTAYMREPWGEKSMGIFDIEDTTFRGIVNYSRDQLLAIVSAVNELDCSFTAHSTGGGGVDLLLDVFGEVNRTRAIRDRRFSIIHGNFYTPAAMEKMAQLGVYANMQAAWFYKDADAMSQILGEERIKTFHPYKSMLEAGMMINGGSDHMVKWDADASINPYNPFLAIWSMVTRKTENSNVVLPYEAVSREDALKMYTINNAWASFEEDLKGSIEPGKLADLAVLSDDLLTCPEDQIKKIVSEMTIVNGKIVYSSGTFSDIRP